MPLLSKYCLPGLAVEDHSVEVPLDWRGTSPAALAGVADPCPSRLASESAGLESDPAFAEEWETVQKLAGAYVSESARRVSVS